MHWLDRFNTWVSYALLTVAGLALLAVVGLVFTNIVMRQFQGSIRGVPEIVGWLTAIIISFSLPYAQRQKAHIDLDVLTNQLPFVVRRVLQFAGSVLALAFFVMVAIKVQEYGVRVMSRGSVSATLRVPYHGFIFAVSFGLGAFCLILLTDSLKYLKQVFRP